MAAGIRKPGESQEQYHARLDREQEMIDRAARGTRKEGTGAPVASDGRVIVNNRAARRAHAAKERSIEARRERGRAARRAKV